MQNQYAMSELSLLHSQFPYLAQWIKLELNNGEEVEGQIFTYDRSRNVVVLQQKCVPENGVVIPGTNPKYNFRIIKISYIKKVSIPSNENKNDDSKTATANDASSSTTSTSNKTDSKAQANNKTKNDSKNNKDSSSKTGENEDNTASEATSTQATENEAQKNKKNPNDPYSNSLSNLVPLGPINIDDIVTREKRALKEEFQRQNRIGVGVTEEAQKIFDALSKTMPCSWNNKFIVVMDEITIAPPYNAKNCSMVPGKSIQESILERVQKVLELEKKKIRENKGK